MQGRSSPRCTRWTPSVLVIDDTLMLEHHEEAYNGMDKNNKAPLRICIPLLITNTIVMECFALKSRAADDADFCMSWSSSLLSWSVHRVSLTSPLTTSIVQGVLHGTTVPTLLCTVEISSNEIKSVQSVTKGKLPARAMHMTTCIESGYTFLCYRRNCEDSEANGFLPFETLCSSLCCTRDCEAMLPQRPVDHFSKIQNAHSIPQKRIETRPLGTNSNPLTSPSSRILSASISTPDLTSLSLSQTQTTSRY